MIREIKFEYGFNSTNGIVKKSYYLHEIPFMHDKCDVWQMLPVVYVRQFTGLKDINGIEIYEGDIVKYKTYYYSKEREVVEEVKWIDAGYTDLFGEPEMYGFLVHWGECEIIGNIYESK
jgi:hypothetical protein